MEFAGGTGISFQFTPLREGRRIVYNVYKRTGNFNSRPSARGDVAGYTYRRLYDIISIHAPPRGATLPLFRVRQVQDISIHAPPRGATVDQYEHVTINGKFQFTPLREGRPALPLSAQTVRQFQFTPLREGRPDVTFYRSGQYAISIHAPPRGATRLMRYRIRFKSFQFTPLREGRRKHLCGALCAGLYFNSRPSARGDRATLHEASPPTLFQFTPLREGRLRGAEGVRQMANFNSRPSARGDEIES